MISDPVVRPKIVRAAAPCITAARRNHAISPGTGQDTKRAHAPQHPDITRKRSNGDSVPVSFEDPINLLPENIVMFPCLQLWRRAGLCAAGLAMSDETLVDVAPSPPRTRLQADGQRVVGLLVMRPGVLAW